MSSNHNQPSVSQSEEVSILTKSNIEKGLVEIPSWQWIRRGIKSRIRKQLDITIPQTIEEIPNFISSINESWTEREVKNLTFALELTIKAILKGKDPRKVMGGINQPRKNLPMIDWPDYWQMY